MREIRSEQIMFTAREYRLMFQNIRLLQRAQGCTNRASTNQASIFASLTFLIQTIDWTRWAHFRGCCVHRVGGRSPDGSLAGQEKHSAHISGLYAQSSSDGAVEETGDKDGSSWTKAASSSRRDLLKRKQTWQMERPDHSHAEMSNNVERNVGERGPLTREFMIDQARIVRSREHVTG